jgi:hypothetical protein
MMRMLSKKKIEILKIENFSQKPCSRSTGVLSLIGVELFLRFCKNWWDLVVITGKSSETVSYSILGAKQEYLC